MRTNTEKYRAAHGREPKGCGLWFFEMTGTDGNGRFTTYEGQAHGTMPEARKWVAQQFKSEVGGVKTIVECVVLP